MRENRIALLFAIGLGAVFYSMPIRQIAGGPYALAFASFAVGVGLLCLLVGSALWLKSGPRPDD